MHLASRASAFLGCELFVKRDDETHPSQGGSKIRKLVHIFEHARACGAQELVTIGAVGSNHLLATAVHGRAAGFFVNAIVVAQPRTENAERAAQQLVESGATLTLAHASWQVPLALAAVLARSKLAGRRTYLIPPGGSSLEGAMGHFQAFCELKDQVEQGELDGWPELIVCALGSGSSHAGLLAGALASSAPTRIVGVRTTDRWMLSPSRVLSLARSVLNRVGAASTARAADVWIIDDQLGKGFGHPTEAGQEAIALFKRDEVPLDSIYMAKAAAALMSLAHTDPKPKRILLWNSWGPLGTGALNPLSSQLQRLLR